MPNIESDCVIHSGDVSNSIDEAVNSNEVMDFLDWFESLNAPVKILVPGNHDWSIYSGAVSKEQIESRGITLLINEGVILDDRIKIWGSPYTPKLFERYTHWAWGLKRSEMDKVWNLIPQDTDILITHGPPKGILDLSTDKDDKDAIAQCGDACLYNKVLEVSPSIHMFGHIHDEKTFRNFGVLQRGLTRFSNGSCAGRSKIELCNGGNIFHI
jgi:Icc-related predicted phosphoesterase